MTASLSILAACLSILTARLSILAASLSTLTASPSILSARLSILSASLSILAASLLILTARLSTGVLQEGLPSYPGATLETGPHHLVLPCLPSSSPLLQPRRSWRATPTFTSCLRR